MKTITTTLLSLAVSGICFSNHSNHCSIPAIPSAAQSGNIHTTRKSDAKTTAAPQQNLLTRSYRNSSYCRSFMPFAEDPCNHTTARNSFC